MGHKPSVLLLGDSIRMSYQPLVAQKLEGSADVVGPEDNCQYSLYTLSSLDRWLNQLGVPDVAHWNNGIHDAGHNPNRSPVQIPIDVYRANLEFILNRLEQVSSQVIWATTTPVHPKRAFLADQWSWRNEEIDQYNAMAVRLMQKRGIPINDLHTLILSHVDRYLCEDQLHLSDEGMETCAEAVVTSVKPYLLETRR